MNLAPAAEALSGDGTTSTATPAATTTTTDTTAAAVAATPSPAGAPAGTGRGVRPAALPRYQYRPPTVRQAPAGRQAGRRNYSHAEMISLAECVYRIKPIGGLEWDQVVEEHSVNYPGRDVDSLRRKFAQIANTKVPTGNPNCPQWVRIAKRAKIAIAERADIGDGEEFYDLEAGAYQPPAPSSDFGGDDDNEEEAAAADQAPDSQDPSEAPSGRSDGRSASDLLGSGAARPLVSRRRAGSSNADHFFRMMEVSLLQQQEEAKAAAEARNQQQQLLLSSLTSLTEVAKAFIGARAPPVPPVAGADVTTTPPVAAPAPPSKKNFFNLDSDSDSSSDNEFIRLYRERQQIRSDMAKSADRAHSLLEELRKEDAPATQPRRSKRARVERKLSSE